MEFTPGLVRRAPAAVFLRTSFLADGRRFFGSEFRDGAFLPFFVASLVLIFLGTGVPD